MPRRWLHKKFHPKRSPHTTYQVEAFHILCIQQHIKCISLGEISIEAVGPMITESKHNITILPLRQENAALREEKAKLESEKQLSSLDVWGLYIY